MGLLRSKALFTAILPLGLLISSLGAGNVGTTAMPQPSEIVDRYVRAITAENEHRKDLTMDVKIDAKLPSLKKQGSLHALRFVSRLGRIVYRGLTFEGDDTIKKEVIARYLSAEREAGKGSEGNLSVTPQNYKFSYKRMDDYAGTPVYVFEVKARQKRAGLYNGELWIDSRTYLPLREWGEWVKNPSLFVKDVYFVRDYYLYEGRAVPRRIISAVDTRLVGKAELTIWFDNFSTGQPADFDTSQVD
jgi:hypothetical protein